MKRIILCLFVLSIAAPEISATSFLSGEEVKLSALHRGDLYIGAGQIFITAPVLGDLVAAGGSLSLEDSIMGDVIIGGGRVNANSFIGDDLRIAGGEIVLSGIVEGDVIVFGGSLRLSDNAIVKGDLVCFGGEVSVYGRVEGNVRLYAGKVMLGNEIGGNAEIRTGELTMNGNVAGDMIIQTHEFSVDEMAACKGQMRYWRSAGEFDLSKVCGNAVFDTSLSMPEEEINMTSIRRLLGIGLIAYWLLFVLASFLVLIIMEYYLSGYFDRASENIRESFIKSFGYGMLYLLGMPVLIIISFVTIIGFPIGILALCLYGLTLLYGTAVVGLCITHHFRKRSGQGWTFMQIVLYGTLTVAILKIIFLVPWLGTVLKTVAMAAAYGTFLMMFFEKMKTVRPA